MMKCKCSVLDNPMGLHFLIFRRRFLKKIILKRLYLTLTECVQNRVLYI